ncbi:MAG: hypothetical protein COV70_03540 [Parcubacteria group bacterium CG11_big_fil_rev_8_21_14_0_20_39_22]|nr:MAG: hypothetical protein COV70_03540 [Parcubacteria group bacterium CG11_big_fil_rev_8_21_14_0_20_39_22]
MVKNKTNSKGFGIGVTTALAALGAYYLYGTKEGRQRRAKVRGWVLKMKGEVLEEIEKMKDLNEEAYNAVVDNVAKRYKAAKNVDNKELEKVSKDLKRHWKELKTKIPKTEK